MTIKIYKSGDDLFLDSQFVSLKISNLELYIKRHWKNEHGYSKVGLIPKGLSRTEKELYLVTYRKELIRMYEESAVKNQSVRRTPSMTINLDDDEEDDELEEEKQTETREEVEDEKGRQ